MNNFENLRVPKYVQLMIKLKEQIEDHTLKPGSPLPTRERLMKENDLSLSTVTRAIAELERQGWLVSRQGSGTYVVNRSNIESTLEQEQLTIGVLLPSSQQGSFELAHELTLEAHENNVRILAMFSPNDEDVEINHARYLFEKKIDALIWSPVMPKRHIGVASLFAKNKTPVIVCEKVYNEPGGYVICVRSDYYNGTRKALHHLHELGHYSIAYVGPKGSESDFGPIPERWNAYKDFMKEIDAWNPEELVLTPNLFQEWHLHADQVKPMFEGTNAPTAILGYDDTTALDAAKSLESVGFRIPEELSIVGNGDSIVSQYAEPRLTTVSACRAEYVDAIFRTLFSLVSEDQEAEHPSPEIVVPQRLINRNSAKPIGDTLAKS